ncbi:hypothetical protein TGDOM2_361400 [Toxoplasma gondii GAB2-2007-GAL-DOM2]|uniref:Uncharacterized protein n=1 Tax=Toxoplasma gondii GAB2-2007-GAL-DOM2 TaxID=1130820 RepID=A0A086JFB8_TOXGO|nr:hypothetical protein TGDOM2_361400 [Toxoplasma gondii GAB2-2007-GAL-DOM2]
MDDKDLGETREFPETPVSSARGAVVFRKPSREPRREQDRLRRVWHQETRTDSRTKKRRGKTKKKTREKKERKETLGEEREKRNTGRRKREKEQWEKTEPWYGDARRQKGESRGGERKRGEGSGSTEVKSSFREAAGLAAANVEGPFLVQDRSYVRGALCSHCPEQVETPTHSV